MQRERFGGWVGVAAIVLLAFGLRIYAVAWGLPYADHPDEPAVVDVLLGMLRRGDLNPHFFDYPSLYLYAELPVFQLHWAYGRLTGLYHDFAQLPPSTHLYVTTPGFFLWGRVLTVLVGTLTTGLLYRVGRQHWTRATGVVAALFLATLPFHMRHSQYITTDVAGAFMVLLALLGAVRLIDQARLRDYVLAGLLVGLAGSTKYNMILVALAVIMAHLLRWERQSLRRFWLLSGAGLSSLVGFVVGSPYALLDARGFVQGFVRQYKHYSGGYAGDLIGAWPVGDYLQFFWADGLRPVACMAALIGIGVALWRRDRKALVLLSFIGPYTLFFLSEPQHFMRNLMPVIVALAIFVGIGVVALSNELARMAAQRALPLRLPLLTGMLTLLCVGWPAIKAIELTSFYAKTQSRMVATDYIRTKLPRGAPIAVMLHPVQWAGEAFILPMQDLTERPPTWYRAQGFRYLLLDDRTANPQRVAGFPMAAAGNVFFPGDRQGTPGPPLTLIDLGQHLEQLAIMPQPALFGDRLRLLGYQRGAGVMRAAFTALDEGVQVKAGQTLQVNLYWQAQLPLDTDYAIFLHLLDPTGQRVTQRDTLIRASDYRTAHWQVGELVIDLADLPIPAGLPAGTYQLLMGVYRMDNFQRLPLPGAPNDALTLMQVVIK